VYKKLKVKKAKKKKNNYKKFINLNMTYEFIYILIYLIISLLISILLLLASYLLAVQQADPEKVSSYECGFNPFDDARHKFDVRFYLVGILFIIFDLEVMFLFPWAVNLSKINQFGYYSMMVFLLILTIGFIYEWKKGALDWE
jgi:NADH:ubiquinone oxidoreductase subunit 3 (subunit A)